MMTKVNKQLIGCVGLFMCFSTVYAAQETVEKTQSAKIPSTQYMLNTIYSYLDFRFNSQNQDSLNRFKGHSNLYMAGGNVINNRYDIITGLFYFNLDTKLQSDLILPYAFSSHTEQVIQNNSLYGRILKQIRPSIFINLSGGYGDSHVHYDSKFYSINMNNVITGHAHAYTKDWFANVTALYTNNWQRLTFNGNINFLYNNVNERPFNFYLNANSSSQRVAALTNKASFVTENAELIYTINEKFSPFINAQLIQVTQFSDSRPIISPLVVSAYPDFNVDRNGYKLGGGFSLKHKQFTLRVEQQYTQRSHDYYSNQSIITLTIIT